MVRRAAVFGVVFRAAKLDVKELNMVVKQKTFVLQCQLGFNDLIGTSTIKTP